MHADGHDEHVEFVGMVTAVRPLVSVTRPGDQEPFTLPADPKSYRPVPRSTFAPEGLDETAWSPRYETTWRVKAPPNAAAGPKPGPFEERTVEEKKPSP